MINQVGAVALGAKLDCDAFADAHSSTAHYDPKSFVGMPVCLASLTHAHPTPLDHSKPIVCNLLAVETYVGVDLCGNLQHGEGQVSLAAHFERFTHLMETAGS